MMDLLSAMLQQSTAGGIPAGEIKVCTVSGAGTSAVNGDYYTDSANPTAIAKHVSNNYWIRIGQYHIGEGLYSYMIYDSVTAGQHYYEWFCTESLNCNTIDITNGASPAPTCTRGSEIACLVYHAGTTSCNGVYKTHYLNASTAKHVFDNVYLCGIMGPPDYGVLAPNDYGTEQYYIWSASSSIPLTSNIANGSSPAAIIYN